ncbi:MAG: putative toxin-antitoxin system toxin component, PIN family [Armatimonadota bacterium]|nr:putative toxin-antitoxin system toxin component, PIN family [Armatimonadota bacterium]MDR7447731.1 putative toxin-antitoxin system toxin component, PIN family [Armatimonadota bacterium]MDR7458506.1 putative toxin-antitoxin system toxin component, PIN family [Armatimonadota bacterium]MDR7479935.1 putative toxin-antitoxin system toxin component, PIN family [Armatimonadota bacterium]MDR7488155.1 putative toxin-antitoxin system toxin component, PIN family [Armatimonadota bacterium]
MIRAVVDPGVLVAALLAPDGTPARLVRSWLQGAFELVACARLLAELEEVLLRPEFRRYATADEVRDYVDVFRRLATAVPDPTDIPRATPDPGDDYLVALARASGATALVSGDRHLLGLRGARPPVMTPRHFLDLLHGA